VATIQGWLLLKVWLLIKVCGYYSRVATIKGVATIQGWLLLKVWLLFKGGYYSRVATIKGVTFNQVNAVHIIKLEQTSKQNPKD